MAWHSSLYTAGSVIFFIGCLLFLDFDAGSMPPQPMPPCSLRLGVVFCPQAAWLLPMEGAVSCSLAPRHWNHDDF